jgi:aspartyl-tRNA(Asn)/glutamyl-tRNA(Gln) amidotransferase subunit A
MHKGHRAAAGSRILENFISPIDAEVKARIEAAGICILGKTKMDEFGAGGLFGNSELSSGAVAAVADGTASFALCNDYTGAVGVQAAASGVCCIRPTYGTVSRYGLIPSVPSMDQIGIVCKTPAEGFRFLPVIAGHDPKDGAMLTWNPEFGFAPSSEFRIPHSAFRIGVATNVPGCGEDMSAIAEFSGAFKKVDVELEFAGVYAQVMQILCCAELSNSISRYDGVKFGYRASGFGGLRELYTKSRTEALGINAKLAALLGAMVLSQDNYMRYYDKAMRIRRLIKESFKFDEYDIIALPAGPPHNLAAYCPALCGFPAVTFPYKGGAILLIADAQCESSLQLALEAVGL